MMILSFRIIVIYLTCVATREVKKTSRLSGINLLDGICLDKRSDRLVYRHKNDTHVYVAFDVLKTGEVHVFTWNIIRPPAATFISTDVNVTTVYSVDFRKGVNRDHIIGGTSRRHMEKFKHRVERKMKHCKRMSKEKKKKCKLTAIHSLFVRLKIRKINFDNVDGCDT